jgi:hypothetical protein
VNTKLLGRWPAIAVAGMSIMLLGAIGRFLDTHSAFFRLWQLAYLALVAALLVLLILELVNSKPFQFWRQETSLKLLFDHFRNIGLCGAVFFAADFLMVKGAFPSSILSIAPMAGTLVLNVVALLSLGLQVNYFQNTIIEQGIGKIHSYVVLLINFILVTAILQYIAFTKFLQLFGKA